MSNDIKNGGTEMYDKEIEHKLFNESFEKVGVKRESKNSALLIIENNRRILGYAESQEESDFMVRRAMNILF